MTEERVQGKKRREQSDSAPRKPSVAAVSPLSGRSPPSKRHRQGSSGKYSDEEESGEGEEEGEGKG